MAKIGITNKTINVNIDNNLDTRKYYEYGTNIKAVKGKRPVSCKSGKGKSSGPGGISFLYGEGNRQAITYQAYFPEEKDFFIFPAWLKHWVAPFMSDVERVSVSGNIASHIPFKNVKPELLRKVAKKWK